MFSIRWEWLSKAPQTSSSWGASFGPKQLKKKTLKEEDMEKLSESPRLPSPT